MRRFYASFQTPGKYLLWNCFLMQLNTKIKSLLNSVKFPGSYFCELVDTVSRKLTLKFEDP